MHLLEGESRQEDLAPQIQPREPKLAESGVAWAHVHVGDVREMIDESHKGREGDAARDEEVLVALREAEVGLVLDQQRVCPDESRHGETQLPLLLLREGGIALVIVAEVKLPESVRQDVFWQRLQEYPVRVPNQVKLRILGHDELTSLDELVVERRDVSPRLSADEP